MSDPQQRFIPSEDGLVVHEPKRDLHWTRNDVSDVALTFDRAVAAIKKLNAEAFGGFSDWRLPSVEELFLLADRSRFSPAIDTDAFPDCGSSWYWSGTEDAESPSECAWVVLFGGGYSGVLHRGVNGRVRAVRGASRQ